jgi:hypothetical protein
MQSLPDDRKVNLKVYREAPKGLKYIEQSQVKGTKLEISQYLTSNYSTEP